MGKIKKTKKFAAMKRMISLKDQRIKPEQRVIRKKKKEQKHQEIKIVEAPQYSSALFFKYNTQLGPPFHVLLDTNYINFCIKNKIDVVQGMMDCLYAKCVPYVTDCVLGELEKLGSKYRIALKVVKDPRFERLPCMHKGTYADDCLVQRVTQEIAAEIDADLPVYGQATFSQKKDPEKHKCYIIATCDKDLQRRIRKIPGVPIMFVKNRRCTIERLPDAFGAPKV